MEHADVVGLIGRAQEPCVAEPIDVLGIGGKGRIAGVVVLDEIDAAALRDQIERVIESERLPFAGPAP